MSNTFNIIGGSKLESHSSHAGADFLDAINRAIAASPQMERVHELLSGIKLAGTPSEITLNTTFNNPVPSPNSPKMA
jgi:hypothetical protein